MAYRRSITTRAKFLYQHQLRVVPSVSHSHHDDNDNQQFRTSPSIRINDVKSYVQNQYFTAGNKLNAFRGTRTNAFLDRRFMIPWSGGIACSRNFSSGSVGEGTTADNIEILNDVFVDKVADVAAQASPVVSEVTVAAADSFFPVAALQYLIDYVHVSTGSEWWVAIALTTLLIRGLQLPLIINQLKSTSKFTLLRPKLEAIKEEMQNRDMSPAAVAEGQARMKELFKEYGVTPFTPLRGILISGPIFCSFFFAINNMVEKVPSFKEGGAFWFTDLTTPDTMYIFPVLTALTFWITVELNAQEGLEGNPTAGTIKNVSRVFAALTIPLTASFPKAIFCYWMASNMFSLVYGLVVKNPKVKKILGIPIIPVAPPSADQKPPLPFFETLKKYAAAQKHHHQQQQSLLPPATDESSKPTNQRIPSSSVLNQRIKSLEKEVKSRKKSKKK